MTVQNNDRFRWVSQVMDIKPGNNILEIGCGVGFAIESIAMKLGRGKITAVDKSQSMIDKAVKRNQEHIKNKRAELYTTDLIKFHYDGIFDKVFCFNVNVFWTKDSITEEADVIRKHLAKKGILYIFYGPLFAGSYKKIATAVNKNLAHADFNVVKTVNKNDIQCCCFVAVTK